MPPAAPIAGLQPHEAADWLPPDAETQPAWLRQLSDRHRAAVAAHDEAIIAVIDVDADKAEAARAYRRELRRAVAVGDPAPERPFDPAVQEAQLEVAREDAVALRDHLAEMVLEALAELRQPERRQELEPYLAACSQALRHALREGPQGFTESTKAALRDRLVELDNADPGGTSEPVDETAPVEERDNRVTV